MQKKRIFPIALLFILCLVICSAVACNNVKNPAITDQEQDDYSDEIELTLRDGSYAVTDYHGDAANVIIPESKDGISVTVISEEAFRESANLVSVTLPESIRTIGKNAFYKCKLLSQLQLPNGITSIGDGAFYGCESLKSVSLPTELSSLGTAAFSGCVNITEIRFARKISDIGDQAFYGCNSLLDFIVDDTNPFYKDEDGVLIHKKNTLVSFPAGRCGSYRIPTEITKIGDYAFAECKNLTELDLNSVTEIGAHAFQSSGLTSVLLPVSVQTLGEYAFYQCSALKTADIGTIPSLPESVFRNCTSLTDLQLNSVCSINNQAFKDCTSLKNIFLPESLSQIGNFVFSGCVNLNDITVSASNHTFRDENGVLLNAEGNKIITFPCGRTGSYIVPDGIKDINAFAFFGCSLEEIDFSDVASIGRSAFAGCSFLKNVTFSDNLQNIGEGAFDGCSSLTIIELPSGITEIRQLTFRNCSSLSKITLSQNLISIGQMAFTDCTSLKNIALPASLQYVDFAAFAGCLSLSIHFSGSTADWEPGWNPDNCPVIV